MGLSRDRIWEGYEVHCDAPGCTASDMVRAGWENQARIRLKERGWRGGERVWNCRRHAEN